MRRVRFLAVAGTADGTKSRFGPLRLSVRSEAFTGQAEVTLEFTP